MTSEPARRDVNVGAFVGGFFIALVFNFALAFLYIGSGPSSGVVAIVAAWLLTAALFYGLYRFEQWLAFGAIGGYAALFLVLLIGGGITGPYTCFGPYGYPAPYP